MQELIQQIQNLWQDVISHPELSIGIIFNLIIIESLLSVDNAAVLATMVVDLPQEQKNKALKYGIWGAYIFRGLAMIFAAFLIKIWWIKPLGGLYLLYLVYNQFNKDNDGDDPFLIKILVNPIKYIFGLILSPFSKLFIPIKNWLDSRRKMLGIFWSTVILVEIMDMAFSIDNVFAAVAFTPNILLVCIGVFIGILAMRFIAQWFVKLMEKYSFLESAAFIVIAVLGVKLLLSIYTHFYPCSSFSVFIEGDHECLKAQGLPLPTDHKISNGDIITSILTVCIFFFPILTSILFNFPKKNLIEKE
jgi:YkoY family integral membrane protein